MNWDWENRAMDRNEKIGEYIRQLALERTKQIETNKLSSNQIRWIKFKDWLFNTRVKIIRK